jgi:putative Ca2+/H+ antiporter (TMEM165/GDT1 family)
VNVVVVAIVFGVTSLAELPDKSLFASLVLGMRYRALPVWLGVAAAFAIHVVVAVLAGRALSLLPHRILETLVAVVFVVGAAIVLVGEKDGSGEDAEVPADDARARRLPPSFRRIALMSFGVVFVGEWGDITQITTANYAARYGDPVSVAVGAVAALWAVAALAVLAGPAVLARVPVTVVRRVSGAVLLLFAALSAYQAVTGQSALS